MTHTLTRPASRALAVALLLTLLATVLTVVSTVAAAPQAAAANSSDFKPGNIISDAEYGDYQSMTVAEIQAFLNKVGPKNCKNCLRQYKASSYDRAASAGRCPVALTGKSDISAAQMIYDVAQACRINPKVLLVTLQKEMSLLTLSAPESWRYQRAMGYACPDSAPCNTAYYGLFIQLYSAASQLNWYGNPKSSFTYYPVGKSTSIRYNPKSSCGSKKVFIENRATAALYYYTPYQPNAAALANFYGTGDSCSAYGNRNFWRMYTDWFGNPSGAAPAPEPTETTPAPEPSPTATVPLPEPSPSVSISVPEPTPTPTETTPAPEPEPTESTPPSGPSTVKHKVVKGDTVWALSIKYKTTTSAIIKANNLGSNALIRVGQVLTIPVPGAASGGDPTPAPEPEPEPEPKPTTPAKPKTVTHTVKKGDTVWALSIKYKTTTSAIIKANGLNSRALIRVGQKLTIPVKGATVSSSGGSGGASASGGSTESPSTPKTVTHTVVKGDTVWALSIKYKTTTSAIIKANNLGSNALIRVGQKLTIPVA